MAGINSKGAQQFANLKVLLAKEKKFSSRTRLFFGNVPENATDDEMIGLFEKYGDTKEYYVSRAQSWGFIKMDYKINAEMAKTALDGMKYKGRYLRVKFATHGTAVEVHGIGPSTSNELLEKAFGFFGDVERATVVCDMKGKSRGYGIVEFGWKKPAQIAIARANDGFFLLGRLPKPVTVKMFDKNDYVEGVRERDLARSSTLPLEREYVPRFAFPGTPEHDWCEKWRSFEKSAQEKRDALEEELKREREQLENDMEMDLRHREMNSKQQELMEMQHHAQLQNELMRREEMHQEMMMSRQREEELRKQSDIHAREGMLNEEFRRQEEILRRQQLDLEMRKREYSEGLMRDSALPPVVASGAKAPPPWHRPPPGDSSPSNFPRMPGRMPTRPFSRPPPGAMGPNAPFDSSQMGHFPRPKFDQGGSLDGFFESKRPRMS